MRKEQLYVSNLPMNVLIRMGTVTSQRLQKLGSGRNASRARIPASKKSRMNLRHAAALARGGWYLMTPPAVLRNSEVDKDAPLGK